MFARMDTRPESVHDKYWRHGWVCKDDQGRVVSLPWGPTPMRCISTAMWWVWRVSAVCTLPEARRQGCVRTPCSGPRWREMFARGQVFSRAVPLLGGLLPPVRLRVCSWIKRCCIPHGRDSGQALPGQLQRLPQGGAGRLRGGLRAVCPGLQPGGSPPTRDWHGIRKLDPAGIRFMGISTATPRDSPGICLFQKGDGGRQAGDGVLGQLRPMAFCADRESFDAMLSFAKGFAAYYDRWSSRCPATRCPEFLLDERVSQTHAPYAMARVVNSSKRCAWRPTGGAGSARIGVTDPQLPQNTGVWAVAFGQGQAVRVEKVQSRPTSS